jgi:hypothetical protein
LKKLVLWGCLLGLPATAAEVVSLLTLDPSESRLTLRLTVTVPPFSLSSDQTQPLTGTMPVGTRWAPDLQGAALQDLRWEAVTNYEFDLGFGVTAGLTNLVIRHGQPGTNQPFAAVNGGTVMFQDPPYRLSGLAGYLAVPPGCSILSTTVFGCQGTIDLAQRPTRPWETFQGTLQVISNRLWFDGTFRFSVPIDETDQGLGQVSGSGRVLASGPIAPCLWIERDEFTHTLRWPSVFTDFVVERTAGGAPPWRWSVLSPVFDGDDGITKWAAFDTEPEQSFFYRLKGPPVIGP